MNKRRFRNRCFLLVEKLLTLLLVFSFAFGNLGSVLQIEFLHTVEEVEAAEVAIDTTANITASSHLHTGPQTVFINDQTGYKFYRDLGGQCVYAKTTDGGTSWGSPVIVDSQTDCFSIAVWYDKWTPNDTGDYIHIATIDGGTDDVWYNRLDTTTDTRLTGSTAIAASINPTAQGATNAVGANFPTITKGTDGTVYIAQEDSTDSYVVECSTTCNLATSWTETAGPRPQDLALDFSILVPLLNGNVMLINRDISADDIRTKIWNNGTGAWDATWTTIDANANDNTTYDIGLSATVDDSGNVYLAYTAGNSAFGTDDEVRTALYTGTWSVRTDALTGTAMGVTGTAISRDESSGNIYVAYTARTTAGTNTTGNVYWKLSTDDMSTWGTQNGPVNISPEDIYGVDLNISSNQRVYASWNITSATDEVRGDTIADLIPGVVITTNGSQTATLNAPSTNTHVGGSFVVTEYVNSRDVTAVTLTEDGTIDGSTEVENITLYYENDSSAPYNCASETYGGVGDEIQFGSSDVNGFSAADGVSIFSGSSANVTTTSSLCFYVVLDVKDSVNNGDTLNITIANPPSDMTVTNSGEVGPVTAVDMSGSTTVLNDAPTQTHFHFRNDNGTELTATSRTGGSEDTNLSAIQQNTPFRLRVGVSNEGGASTPSIQYRLEYAIATSTCDTATGWTDVGASSDDIDMSPTANLNEGDNTSDIAIGTGGVSDENTSYQGTNGAVRDVTSQTGGVVLSSTQYVDLEYSIVATASATEGNTYCFRVTNAGTPLSEYSVLPRMTIAADVAVTVSGSQTSTTNIPATDYYIGGQFVITENSSSRTVSSITITENGTVDAQTRLDNIRLRYDLDTSVPYDCASESYAGTETLFGLPDTDTDGFSSANGTSTFTGTESITTTRTMCVYPVMDVLGTALNGETLNIVIQNPSTDVVVSGGGSVSPSVTRDITGETTLQGAVLTQSHYHWRNDNDSEAAADSLTGGTQDTPISNIAQNAQVRLRMEVSNEGTVTSPDTALRLEYGTKITTCDNVSSWTDVGEASGAWDMFATANLTEGGDTTNVAAGADGAVTDENTTFKTPNSAVKDTSSQIATTTFTSAQYLEAEFSIRQTSNAAFDATYCFRLSNAGSPLNAYTSYPELTTSAERDFEIQRGTATVTGTGITLTAGVDYVAPSSLSNAFVRITNSHHTGAGSSLAGTQNADDVTAYISNPQNLLTSFTITRPATAINNTRVSWEIVEFIGTAGSDNEMIVRDQGTVTYGTTATTIAGTAVGSIADDSDVVVFITGQFHPDTAATNYNSGQSTSAWNAGADTPQFTRGVAGGDATRVSYAVVEFTGINWEVQRAEHTYTAAGTTETENITAVNSLTRTFVHSQKRINTGLTGTDEFGHEVWLSSIGAVSFFLEAGATTPSGQTSVAWIIENTQTSNGSMVVTRSDGSSNGGAEPLTLAVSIGTTLADITNASIFASTRGALTTNLYPRPIAGFTITSTTQYELWRSDTGAAVTYRVEVVEWPTAGLTFRQNDYRFYVDSDELDPIDPWPVGGTDLGENTVITGTDAPLGDGERIRIRMSLTILNSTLPEQSKSFKLQYGERVSTCGAIDGGSWVDVGAIGSGAIWRGYDATSVSDGASLSGDPATAGDLNLAVSDSAGTLEEENVSSVNPYTVQEGDDIEYDWIVEQNGATAETFYCFRMIESNDTVLSTYSDYPTLRTSSFTPATQNWQWFDDEENETPAVSLSSENSAPTDIANNDAVKLRVTVKETENIAREDIRFKLQYSEYPNFASAIDVVATSSCTASSTWCYYNGGGNDNAVISTGLLSDSDSCASASGDGCGTHNEGAQMMTGFRHENGAATEYEFAITAKAPRANAVYYFRLYDITQDIPVIANTAETYPSLVIEGASLVFDMGGLTSGTITEGVTLNATSTATSIPFGELEFDTDYFAAYRLNINTNATEGYQVLMYADQQLLNAYGEPIPSIPATNASPANWTDLTNGCLASMSGCFGYHSGDDALGTGVMERFAPDVNYAGLPNGVPDEVMYSSLPVNDTHDIVYRLRVKEGQSAGLYETTITYIAIPVY